MGPARRRDGEAPPRGGRARSNAARGSARGAGARHAAPASAVSSEHIYEHYTRELHVFKTAPRLRCAALNRQYAPHCNKRRARCPAEGEARARATLTSRSLEPHTYRYLEKSPKAERRAKGSKGHPGWLQPHPTGVPRRRHKPRRHHAPPHLLTICRQPPLQQQQRSTHSW